MHLLPSSLLVLLGAAVSVSAAGGPMPRRLDHGNSPGRQQHHRSIVRARGIPVQADPSLPKRDTVVPTLVQDTHERHEQQARDVPVVSAETVARRQKKRATWGKCAVRADQATSSPSSASSSSTKAASTTSSASPTTSSKTMATTSSAAPSPTSKAATSSKPSFSSAPAAAPTSAASTYKSGWTSLSTPVTNLESISLSVALKSTKGTAPGQIVTSTPDGSTAMEAAYKANTAAAASGWSFYALHGQQELRKAKEAVLTYKLFFADGFTWVKGGKLPGLYGGIPGEYGCSGGEQEDRDICWSARLMWRASGAGELYTYLPKGDTNINACKASGSGAICNNEIYGLSFGRGEFTWPMGQWATVQERVKLNDVGQNNGLIELSVNGQIAIRAQNLNIRTRSDSGFEGIYMSTFFGGNDASYAPTTVQHAWFKDFQIGIVA